MTMTVKELAVALGEGVSRSPSEAIGKVCLYLLKMGGKYWGDEAARQSEAKGKHAKGSTEWNQSDASYTVAFGHWHRLVKMEQAVASALNSSVYGQKKTAEVRQAA